ncbi:hypothetical protein [Xylella fastidiosa]|uniref:Uncharacterized protein n=1 Tax=Xylella fastidiosa subsp. fastidiosa TaxID=644356 RepID=A0AAJ5R2F5_XYLFS|nr:hypothetical protein [Xylella fastidiosa]WCF29115.1 hypothetical protein OK117_04425 [Xylella fastidiosa subsp. fastidiosa]
MSLAKGHRSREAGRLPTWRDAAPWQGLVSCGASFSETLVCDKHAKATGMACGIKALPFSQIVLDT